MRSHPIPSAGSLFHHEDLRNWLCLCVQSQGTVFCPGSLYIWLRRCGHTRKLPSDEFRTFFCGLVLYLSQFFLHWKKDLNPWVTNGHRELLLLRESIYLASLLREHEYPSIKIMLELCAEAWAHTSHGCSISQ